MSLSERWVLLRHEGGRLIAYPGEHPPAEPIPRGWEQIEVVATSDVEEVLEQITDPECMTRGTGGWIDTGAPARIAQNALDALGVSGVTP
jgi:hypothetical protein